jgi:hypothetical protein
VFESEIVQVTGVAVPLGLILLLEDPEVPPGLDPLAQQVAPMDDLDYVCSLPDVRGDRDQVFVNPPDPSERFLGSDEPLAVLHDDDVPELVVGVLVRHRDHGGPAGPRAVIFLDQGRKVFRPDDLVVAVDPHRPGLRGQGEAPLPGFGKGPDLAVRVVAPGV